MIATGFAGFIVSRYLAMYQLGYMDYMWDPLFGFHGGTEKVLNSDLSHSWPVSDGGLGAIAYTFEFLMVTWAARPAGEPCRGWSHSLACW